MYKINAKRISIIINTSSSSLISVTPKKFSDSKLVAKELLNGNAIVINISEMPKIEAIRFIDFITGTLFVTKGAFKKVGEKTYLLTPSKALLKKFSSQF